MILSRKRIDNDGPTSVKVVTITNLIRACVARSDRSAQGWVKFSPVRPEKTRVFRCFPEHGIAALGDLGRLLELIDRVLDVASWDELLGPPGQSA